jgi:RNA-directed DNA polymerase
MKRPGRLLDQIAAPANLLAAYLKARRGKTHQTEVRAFAACLDAELKQMREDLLAGRCRFDCYRTFRIYDPKERLIHAAPFRDRVLHHAVLNVCEPYFERAQVFDSYACRKGKGTRAALLRARDFARRYPCYLKLDVRKYFASISHELLKDMLRRMFKDAHLLALLEAVIDGSENGTGSAAWKSGACPIFAPRGLPIGNLTSQYFANHFLTPLDQHLKRVLRVPGYIRYMDDFVLWGYSTRDLLRWEREARKFCADRLGLELKPACINRSAAGLPFLGFLVLPGELRLTSRSCRRVRRKLKACQRRLDRGGMDEDRAAVTVRSLLARTDWAGGAALRRRLLADDFGRRPKARTASTAVAVGPTMPATAVVRTATTGTGATATTTSASGWFLPPAQENGRMSSIDPGGDPVSAVDQPPRDEVRDDGRALVARADARVERPRPLFLFPEMEEDERPS